MLQREIVASTPGHTAACRRRYSSSFSGLSRIKRPWRSIASAAPCGSMSRSASPRGGVRRAWSPARASLAQEDVDVPEQLGLLLAAARERTALAVPDHEVELAVVVPVGRREPQAEARDDAVRLELLQRALVAVRRIDRQLREQRHALLEGAVLPPGEERDVRSLVADQEVEQAVAVPVRGDRIGLVAHLQRRRADPQRLPLRELRRRARALVARPEHGPARVADQEVLIAVAVEVGAVGGRHRVLAGLRVVEQHLARGEIAAL